MSIGTSSWNRSVTEQTGFYHSSNSSLDTSQPSLYPSLEGMRIDPVGIPLPVSPYLDETLNHSTSSPLLVASQESFPEQNHEIILNPKEFRHPFYRQDPYCLPEVVAPPTFQPEELQMLRCYFNKALAGFHPLQIEMSHPLHVVISSLSQRLLDKYKNDSLGEKIGQFEQAIVELIKACDSSGRTPPHLELIEIALRNHLFLGLLKEETENLNAFFNQLKRFPYLLPQKEEYLINFVTKNNFYLISYPPYSYIAPALLTEIAPKMIDNCTNQVPFSLPLDTVIQNCETLISNQLEQLHLTAPSQCAGMFEASVRNILTWKITSQLATHYRMQFQKDGSLDTVQLEKDFIKLENFNSGKNKFLLQTPPKIQLLTEIFHLPLNDPMPFSSVRAQILKAKEDNLKSIDNYQSYKLWKVIDYAMNWSQKEQEAIESKTAKQLEALEWAEKEWGQVLYPNSYFPSSEVHPLPSAPALTEEIDNPSLQDISSQELPSETQTDAKSMNTSPVISPITSTQIHKEKKDEDIRLVSYVDIAFSHVFTGNDNEDWKAFPPLVKKDILRHVTSTPSNQGKAENIVRGIFKNRGWELLTEMQKYEKAINDKVIDPEFKEKGEEVLDFFYSTKISENFHIFLQKFRALPISKEPRFLKNVFEIAKASNVKIESWDLHWAEYHWQDPKYIFISLQALEQSLHT